MNRRAFLAGATALIAAPFVLRPATAAPFVSPSNPDTASINAAISSLGSGGGMVWCPPGIYTVNDPTINVTSGVTLKGSGDATAIVRASAIDLPLIQIVQGAVGARVRDLYLDMGSFYTPFGMAIDMKQTRRCKVSGLTIANIGKYGIVGNGDAYAEISDNHITRVEPSGTQHNQSIAIGDSLGQPLGIWIIRNRCENTGMLLTIADSVVDGNNVNRSGYGSNMAFGANSARNMVSRNTLTNGVGIDEGGFAVSGIENWGVLTHFFGNTTSFNDGVGVTQGGWGCHFEGHEAVGNGAVLTGGGIGIQFVTDSATNSTSAGTWVNGFRTLNANGIQTIPKQEHPAVAGLIQYGINRWD